MNNNTSLRSSSPLTAMEEIFKTLLDHDLHDMKLVAEWAQRPYENQKMFKEQLLACIRQPGMLSVDTYEKWTNLAVDDQDDLQRELKVIWNTCYPGEKLS